MKLNKTGKKWLSVVLTAVLAVTGTIAWSTGSSDRVTASYADETAKRTEESVNSAFPEIKAGKGCGKGLRKDETVYMIMDADGNEKETVVSEWLRNPEGKDTIKDYTELSDIEDTSGDEEYTEDGKYLIWAADGKDIKYKGNSDGIIPVSCDVTYSLDGEQMSASEIAGKSGNVEIRFDYSVTAHDRVDGYDMTHPYVMASGVVLDENHFRDIEVNSGKVVSEDGNSICLGIAFPGMKDNLALKKNIIDIPESVVITAVTDKFEIDGTYTAALTGILDDMDISSDDAEDKVDQLESAFGKLNSASSKLVKGSRELSDGTDKLADGADKISNGSRKLEKGSKKLARGSRKLADGTASLSKGASQVADGTSKLKKSGGSLAEGITVLLEGAGNLSEGASGLKDGIGKASEGAKSLSDGLSAISSNSETLNAGTAEIETAVFDGATAQLQTVLIEYGKDPEEVKKIRLTPSNYTSILSGIKGTEELKARLDGVEQYTASVKAYTDGVDSAASGSAELYTGIKALDEGAEQVSQGAESINGGLTKIAANMPALSKGINSLNKGASKVSGGASQVNRGASSISRGSSKLSRGVSSLRKGSSQLDRGAGQLSEGAETLAEGMSQFDKEGIRKLTRSLDTDELKDMLGRFGALSDASEKHHFMDGTSGKLAGESKIIFKTGEIKDK
ncbi:MAG: hypothetical protein IKF54_01350 [Eubacterium sp.]|nr:hypothetical protein [Eubacterium sp.]